MLFKLLCTLCTLVSSSSLDHHMLTRPVTDDTVQISVDMDDTVTHNLCDDFTPNITNVTCQNTLFEASEKVDFITITNQSMLLEPSSDDGVCYKKGIPICFTKTYQLTISALNASDHMFMMDKRFTIAVKSYSTGELETVMIILVLVGSSITYAVSSCLQKLFLWLRSENAQMRN